MEAINILVCGNEGARDGIILALLSIVDKTESEIRLFVGTMDLTDTDSRYTPITEGDRSLFEMILREKNPDSRVILLDMGDAFRAELYGGKNMDTRYTPYAMLRLCADMYDLPDKLLYLDTDVCALGDIAELYSVDIEGYEVAGALDYYGRFFISPRYMNSGVMLWNMKEIKEKGTFAVARKICRERKMLLCDQSAIHRAVKRKLILPRKFNEQHNASPDTVIQHFSMRIRWIPFGTEKIKPWQPELLHGKLGVYYLDGYIERWQRIKAVGYAYCK